MPYKSDKIIIAGTSNDRRRKLTEEEKQEIKKKYKPFVYSQRTLAKEYGVSRRLITFILDPQKLANNRHNWKDYYDSELHREYIKKHRRYKHKLYLEGKI